MPLIRGKSKKSLDKNISMEMEAHPDPSKKPQNLAIAYSVQRQSKKKKMAKGGMAGDMPAIKKENYEEKQDIHPMDMMSDDERADSIVDSIMKKRKAKKMADGGMVDLQESNAEEPENDFYTQNESDLDEYDLPELDEHVEEGSSHGNTDASAENMDDDSIVSKIRKKMKMGKM